MIVRSPGETGQFRVRFEQLVPTLLEGVILTMHGGTEVGITASSTQTQGEQPLTATLNLIETVGTANDVVTLPDAVEGRVIMLRNEGAGALQVFPASGDAIDGGATDASVTLATGSGIILGAVDDTDWYTFGGA